MTVYIHGPYEVADISSKNIDSPNGYFLQLYLTGLTLFSSSRTFNLGVNQRKCRFHYESNLRHSPVYSYVLCRMECRATLSKKLCGCIPHFYRKLDGEKVCNVTGLHCLSKYKERLILLKGECTCLANCDEVNYIVEDMDTREWFLGANLQWGLKEYPKMRLRRDVIFGFSDLLVQWQQNDGKCGICGDPYQVKEPRPHEAGGLYAKGIISRHYSVGQSIDIEIELTANHYGRFEIFLCPNNNPKQQATQDCFDRFPLYVGGADEFVFNIPEDGKKKAVFRYQVHLPPYLTCTQCVLQWSYYTGNQWGLCPNGTQAQGCGQSETFRNCADVAIHTSTGGAIPPLFVEDNNPYLLFYRDFTQSAPYNVYPLVVRDQVCVANSIYRMIPGISDWCKSNCLRYPPNCPGKVCECPSTCDAIGKYAGRAGADVYCMDQCLKYNSTCPMDQCNCYEE